MSVLDEIENVLDKQAQDIEPAFQSTNLKVIETVKKKKRKQKKFNMKKYFDSKRYDKGQKGTFDPAFGGE